MAQAFDAFKSLTEGIGIAGKFINSIFKNKYALLVIILVIVSILFVNILKRLLGKIPLFQGAGDEPTNAQGSIVAWCIALLAVISIGYTTKGNVDALIKAFGGPWGSFLVFALAIMLGYSIYHQLEGWHQTARIGIGLIVGSLAASWMLSYIKEGNASSFLPNLSLTVAGLIIIGILHFIFRRRKK